jgi:acyl dehydratase
MTGRWRWRVQAFWRVGDEVRSYRPVFENSEAEAERTVSEMRETLWHFVDLDIRVDRVDRATADAEERRLADLDHNPRLN